MDDGMRGDMTLMTQPEATSLSLLFGLLSEPARLRMVLLLCGRERRVSDLVTLLGMPQPTVSHHLALMRRAGLVVTRRAGKSVFYSLEKRLTFDAGDCELRIANASGATVTISAGRPGG